MNRISPSLAPDLHPNISRHMQKFGSSNDPVVSRILLVVPGRLFRNGIELVLLEAGAAVIEDFETLAEAETALDDRTSPLPDLFIVGVSAEGPTNDDFTRIAALRAKVPDARWILLNNGGSLEFWRQAIESRIDGLLHQDSPGEVLQLLVKLVLLGYSSLPSGLAMALAAGSRDPAESSQALCGTVSPPSPPSREAVLAREKHVFRPYETPQRWQAELSDRESDILRGLVAGLSNKLIARELCISEATVKVHVKALLRKMQVTNRTQAAVSALEFLRGPKPTTPQAPSIDASASVTEVDEVTDR